MAATRYPAAFRRAGARRRIDRWSGEIAHAGDEHDQRAVASDVIGDPSVGSWQR